MSLIEYETTVVIRPDIGGDAVETTLDKVRAVVKTGGGKLIAINHWGKKKLAYEIKKHARGIFVHTHYLGKNSLVLELERNLRISDQVLRFMTIRLATDIAETEREEKEYVRPQYDVDDGSDAENDTDFEAAGDREDRYGDDRGERGDRGDRGDRDDRGDRGDRSDRSERSDRGDRNDRGGDRVRREPARDPAPVPAAAEAAAPSSESEKN